MTRAMLLCLMTAGLYGCRACAINVPIDNNNDDDDTAQEDTAEEDTGPVDTGPLPPCSVPEEEPNNLDSQAQQLPLEQWACGTLLEKSDVETFYFDVPRAGWYRIWVRGQDIGSSSDMQLSVIEPSDYGLLATTSPGSLDPRVVFYADGAQRFKINLADSYYGYGDDYIWEMLVSEDKEPVDWNVYEEEYLDDGVSNNALVNGQLVESGDMIFGLLDPGSDQDFYLIDLPAGEVTLTGRIYAWNYGSPLYSTLTVYDMDGNSLKERSYGESSADLDPLLTYKTTGGVRLAVQVDVQNNSGGGGKAHWYMLEVIVEEDE
ncbi:MAG: hypothetical protein ACI8S6_003036 [Myxococcota bacterium]|jgi:hypothetical protein